MLNACVDVRRPRIGLPEFVKSMIGFICSSGRFRNRRNTTIMSASLRNSVPGMLV